MSYSAATESHWSDLNRRPLDYESRALPLSYSGWLATRGALACAPNTMPWRGFEPRRLSALPPQDSVSTSFTTRASGGKTSPREKGGQPDRARQNRVMVIENGLPAMGLPFTSTSTAIVPSPGGAKLAE